MNFKSTYKKNRRDAEIYKQRGACSRILPVTPSLKDNQEILKEFKDCELKVHFYVNTLNDLQDLVFKAVQEDEDFYLNFYDISKLDGAKKLCEIFSNFYKFGMPSLSEILVCWRQVYEKIKDKGLKCVVKLPRLIAGLCILEGRYYDALECLWHLLYLSEWKNQETWILIIQWSFFIGELGLVDHFLKYCEKIKFEKNAGKNSFQKIIYVYQLIVHKLLNENDEREQKKSALEIITILKQLSLEKPSFESVRLSALLHRALVYASRLKKADIKTIGDPIYNRFVEKENLERIATSRFPVLYRKREKSLMFKEKLANTEEFLLICSSLVEHFECANTLVEECIDVGMMREAESNLLHIWNLTLDLGIPYRVLQPLSLFYFLKGITTYEPQLRSKIGDCINLLLTPSFASKKYYFSQKRYRKTIDSRASTFVDDSFVVTSYATEVDQLNETLADVLSVSSKQCVEQHIKDCNCGICQLKTSWHFSLKIYWINLISCGFSLCEFSKMHLWIENIRNRDILEQRKHLIEVVKSSEDFRSRLPLHFTNVWINATIYFLIRQHYNYNCSITDEDVLEVIDDRICMKYIADAIKCCKFFHLANLPAYLLLEHFKITGMRISKPLRALSSIDLYDSKICEHLKCSYAAQKYFGHLFFREWKRRNCLHLARNWVTRPWHQAQFYIEATIPSVRQSARYMSCRKPRDSTKQFSIDNTCELKSFIDNFLPENVTFVHISLDEAGNLVLVRCHILHEPIIVNLGNIIKCNLLDRLRNILAESDRVVAMHSASPESFKDFWKRRLELDSELKDLIAAIQENWLGKWAALLLPLQCGYDQQKKTEELSAKETVSKYINHYVKDGFSRKSAITLVRLREWFEESLDNKPGNNSWLKLMHAFAEIDGVRQKVCEKILLDWTEHCVPGKEDRKLSKQFMLISVPPSLNLVPWECIPLLEEKSTLVTRIPSLHLFDFLSKTSIPKKVDAKNSFYVLNPGGDLSRTELKLGSYMEGFRWTGITGKAPSKEEIIDALLKYDLFMYMGHGSGGRYFGRSIIINNVLRAVAILMGCSSIKIVDEGPGFDGRSIVYEYLSSHCPSIIGCLWAVTDGEIDRFFIALLKYCFEKSIEIKDEPCEVNTLLEGIIVARKSCKLPYLTGASVAANGIPIASVAFNLVSS